MLNKLKAVVLNILPLALLLAFLAFVPLPTADEAAAARDILEQVAYTSVLLSVTWLVYCAACLLAAKRTLVMLDSEREARYIEGSFGERAEHDPRSTKV